MSESHIQNVRNALEKVIGIAARGLNSAEPLAMLDALNQVESVVWPVLQDSLREEEEPEGDDRELVGELPF